MEMRCWAAYRRLLRKATLSDGVPCEFGAAPILVVMRDTKLTRQYRSTVSLTASVKSVMFKTV
jgi:hypothetical protein